MNGYGPVIVRIVNFFILAFVLLRVFGKATSQFLFARRIRIRKRMLESVVALMGARARMAASHELYEDLPKDIASRHAAISLRCQKECDIVRKDAEFKAEHMIEGARRLAEEDRARAEGLVRARLLGSAFDIARAELVEKARARGGRRFAEEGLDELAALAKREGASELRGDA